MKTSTITWTVGSQRPHNVGGWSVALGCLVCAQVFLKFVWVFFFCPWVGQQWQEKWTRVVRKIYMFFFVFHQVLDTIRWLGSPELQEFLCFFVLFARIYLKIHQIVPKLWIFDVILLLARNVNLWRVIGRTEMVNLWVAIERSTLPTFYAFTKWTTP